jgi:3-oxoacyl-[acyl-carrier-protein] synthase II
MTRRVVVTGVGLVTGLGSDTEGVWRDCLAGRGVVAPIPQQWHAYASFRSCIWAPLTLPDLSARFSRVERSQHDPVTLIACTAAAQALESAAVDTRLVDRRANAFELVGVDPGRCAVFVGTGVGGAHSFMENHAQHVLSRARERLMALRGKLCSPSQRDELDAVLRASEHVQRFNPFVVSMLMPNAPAAYVGIKFRLRGPNAACAQACASGTVAVGRGFRAIADGEADLALVGGCEYLDDARGSIFQGFDVCRALVRDCDPPLRANRPFDAARSGFLFAQGGAAMLLLESAEHATARGARPLAEVAAFAESFDAHSMMSPEPSGEAMESMLRDLLRRAAIDPADVDYVNAHGTGTQSNDACEALVVERLFGRRVAVNSTKSLLGHTIGASGAIEAAVTTLSIRDQRLHPSLNLTDPIADLAFVTRAEERELRYAVSQSFAFGGHNAALLLARPAEHPAP